MNAPDRQRYHTLDAMRGIAALAVVVFHIGHELHQHLFPHAYLAVDFFFMLSGFVLARAYEARLRASLSAARFMEMRVIRLYPLFALGVLLGTVQVTWHVIDPASRVLTPVAALGAFAMNALMLPALSSSKILFPFDVPAWSLFFEIVVNIAFALVLYRMGSRLLALFCTVMGVLLLWAISVHGHNDLGALWSTAGPGLLRVGFSFPLGVLMARLHGAADRRSAVAPLAVFALAIVLAAPWPVPFGEIYDAVAVFILLPALLWLGAGSELPKSLEPAGALLGDISYPLYAIHFPLLEAFVYIFVRKLHLPGLLAGAFFILAVAWLSWFLVHRFDAPVRRWLSGRARLRAAAMPVGP